METERHAKGNVSLAEARRHESGSRWHEASRAYLNALSSSSTLQEVALAGLRRCASQARRAQVTQAQSDDSPNPPLGLNPSELLLGVGSALCGKWGEALRICADPNMHPRQLSMSIQNKWPVIGARIQPIWVAEDEQAAEAATSHRVVWVILLTLLNAITEQNHVSEAMMMCRHALRYVVEPVHRALVLFEAGRVGLNHSHYASGTLALREVLSLAPELSDEVHFVLDELLLTENIHDGALEDLLDLRCREMDPDALSIWVSDYLTSSHLPSDYSITLGDLFYRLSAQSGEQVTSSAVAFSAGAYQCYAFALQHDDLIGVKQQWAFEQLTRLTLTRVTAPPLELDDDEPTLDSEVSAQILSQSPEVEGVIVIELVEGAENRLLIQLKDLQRFDLIKVYYEQKARSVHLKPRDRARAYHALAQIALSASADLIEAVDYARNGVRLAPSEVKLTSLLREARKQSHWPALNTLLLLQLEMIKNSAKRQTLFRALAQGYRREGDWVEAYYTLIKLGVEEATTRQEGHEFHAETEEARGKVFSSETEREISSLLKVKGAALTIGNYMITESSWDDLLRLVHRLQLRGEVVVDLLYSAVREARSKYSFARLLLELYEKEERWQDWVTLIANYSEHVATLEERGDLIHRAIAFDAKHGNGLRASLLKSLAEFLGDYGSPAEEQVAAWQNYFVEQPGDLHAIELLEERADELGAWPIIVDAYETALPLKKIGRIVILERLCEIYEQSLKQRSEAAKYWYQILEISPQNDAAGSWLTLYFAEQSDWYQLLLICALWTPASELHPVWVESKVRGHLGLQELEQANYWWRQLHQERNRRLFIDPLIQLAADQKEGELLLDLIAEAELLHQHDFAIASGDPEGDEPPPVPELNMLFSNEIEDGSDPLDQVMGGMGDLSESDDGLGGLHHSVDSTDDHGYLRLKAKAYSQWIHPPNLVEAVLSWESILRDQPDDLEATSSLVHLYAQQGKRRELVDLLAFVERGSDLVLALRRPLITGALRLETRFKEYTEAFKCWLALYEYSTQDRDLCMAAFARLSERDTNLVKLTQELHKLRADHTPWKEAQYEHWLECAYLNAEINNQWGKAFSMIRRILRSGWRRGEMSSLLIDLSIPLGRWTECIEELMKEGSWRSLKEAAVIAEARLGERSQALDLYRSALEKLSELTVTQVIKAEITDLEKSIHRLVARIKKDQVLLDETVPPPIFTLPSELLSILPESDEEITQLEEILELEELDLDESTDNEPVEDLLIPNQMIEVSHEVQSVSDLDTSDVETSTQAEMKSEKEVSSKTIGEDGEIDQGDVREAGEEESESKEDKAVGEASAADSAAVVEQESESKEDKAVGEASAANKDNSAEVVEQENESKEEGSSEVAGTSSKAGEDEAVVETKASEEESSVAVVKDGTESSEAADEGHPTKITQDEGDSKDTDQSEANREHIDVLESHQRVFQLDPDSQGQSELDEASHDQTDQAKLISIDFESEEIVDKEDSVEEGFILMGSYPSTDQEQATTTDIPSKDSSSTSAIQNQKESDLNATMVSDQ